MIPPNSPSQTPPQPTLTASEITKTLAHQIETLFLEKIFHLLNDCKNSLEILQNNLLIPHDRSELYHNYNALNHMAESPILKSLMSPFSPLISPLSPSSPSPSPPSNMTSNTATKSPITAHNTNFFKYQKSADNLLKFLDAIQHSNDTFFFSIRDKIGLLWNCDEPLVAADACSSTEGLQRQQQQHRHNQPSRKEFLSLVQRHKESLLLQEESRRILIQTQKNERKLERLVVPMALPFGDQEETTSSSDEETAAVAVATQFAVDNGSISKNKDIRVTLLIRLAVLAFLGGDGRVDSRMSQILLKMRNWMAISDQRWKEEIEQQITPYFSDYTIVGDNNVNSNNGIGSKVSLNIYESKNSNNAINLKRGIGALTGGLALGLAVGFTLTPLLPILGASAIGAGFGAGGAGLVGRKIKKRYRDIDDFEFVPVVSVDADGDSCGDGFSGDDKRDKTTKAPTTKTFTRMAIVVSGWIKDDTDYVEPWLSLATTYETYTVVSEKEEYRKLGKIITDAIKNSAIGFATTNILTQVGLAAVLTPLNIIQLGNLIDNPWSICNNLAIKQGDILADAIKKASLGHKPLTLVGYSLGALVIWSALLKLCNEHQSKSKGDDNDDNDDEDGIASLMGRIENVCLFGLPNEIGPLEDWIRIRSVVSGRFIHGYADNDLVLRFIYRGAQMSTGQIAGLVPILFPALHGLENVNMSSVIEGRHMEYPSKIREILDNLGIC